ADPEPIVLTHEQDRHLLALMHGPARRVEGAERGAVVESRVAEARDDDRVARRRQTQALLALEREGEADGAWEVRRDRARLRHDAERRAPEHLVPAAAPWIFGGGDQRERDGSHGVELGHVSRALDEERAVTVVDEARIAGTREATQDHARFVPRRATG